MRDESWRAVAAIINAQADHKRVIVPVPTEAFETGHPEALQDNKFPAMTTRRRLKRKGRNHG